MLNAANIECSRVSSFADFLMSECISPAAEKTRSTPAEEAGALYHCQKEGLFPSEYECTKCHNKQVTLHEELGILCPVCDAEHKQLNTIPVSILQDIEALNHKNWSSISEENYRKIKELLSNIMI